MAKLFISYAREDKPIVEALAAALTHDGHDVWWDRELATHGAFRPQIQEALESADLVLVAWTTRSRVSRFVADEADLALTRGRLLSLLIDGARPALGFGTIHAVNLGGWSDPDDDEGLVPLRREIERRLAGGPEAMPERPAARVFGAAALLCGSTAIVFGLAQAAIKGLAAQSSLTEVLRFGLEHAGIALLLSAVVATFAALRSRRLGLGRLRAVARPYLQALAWGLVAALAIGALALVGEADAGQTRAERVQDLLSIVLMTTLVVAAIVGVLRSALMLTQRK